MLFPIKHENMTARRWPLVTIGLILVNTLVFLCTHQAMEEQEDPLVSAKVQVLAFAAQHPELTVPPKAQQFVTDYQRYYPANWAELQTPNDKTNESEDSQIESPDDRQQLQAEMDSLGTEYSKLAAASITERYAFTPSSPEANCIHQFHFPSRRMVTSDFQYVVPMAGRLRFGGRLGPSFVLGLLSCGRHCSDTT